jgi:hypothetical protein
MRDKLRDFTGEGMGRRGTRAAPLPPPFLLLLLVN